MVDLTEIEATLKYGKIVQKWRIGLLYINIFISCLIPMVSLIMLFLFLDGDFVWEKDMAWGVIYGNLFSIIFGIVSVYYLCHHKKVNKCVENWLYDAVPIKAKITRMDILDRKYKPYQIKVEFSYNAKKYTYFSEPGNIFTGYRKIFLRYLKKDCKILYSPSYEQVMFIINQ